MTKRPIRICAAMLAAVMMTACSAPADQPIHTQPDDASGVTLEHILTELDSKLPDEAPQGEIGGVSTNVASANETRAMWFSYEDLSTALQSADEATFRSKIELMFYNCLNIGINTVIVHVRPFSDSFYPSMYFPWSKYVTGTIGTNPGYDPLALMVSGAKNAGLKIEAWVNPMRAMSMSEIAQVSTAYPIRQWYDDPKKAEQNLIMYSDRLYYNPASQEVRDIIAAGVTEIVTKYAVDAVHIDDYFYPSGLDYRYDAASYAAYQANGGLLTQDEWRRESVSMMVKSMYDAVKKVNPSVQFGVSPQGNPNTSYLDLWADVEKWVTQYGYLDYIAPQLYFGMEHSTMPFETTAKLWSNLITADHVQLRLGLAAYKIGTYDSYAGSAKYEWVTDNNVLATQLNAARGINRCTGVIFFRYSSLFNPASTVQQAAGMEMYHLYSLMK